jgi:hypothetical protein
MEDESFDVPAADIGDLDLSALPPETAAQIERLNELMVYGEETPEQFVELVRLLRDAGFERQAEYLLRRNLIVLDDAGPPLYRELFGTAKPDAFEAAIAAFARQYSVELELSEELDFLDRRYRSAPRPGSRTVPILGGACDVRFDFVDEASVGASVESLTEEGFGALRFLAGTWEEEFEID